MQQMATSQWRKECRANGLSPFGSKNELLSRLTQHSGQPASGRRQGTATNRAASVSGPLYLAELVGQAGKRSRAESRSVHGSPLKRSRVQPAKPAAASSRGSRKRSAGPSMAGEIDRMTIPKLRHELKKRGQSTAGGREELVERLADCYDS